MDEFKEFLFKDMLVEAEGDDKEAADDTPPSSTPAATPTGKKEFGKIGEAEIKKIFRLKSIDIDTITKQNDKSSIQITMIKEKMKYEKSIDDIADALGASSWNWSGNEENPFKLTFNW
jgi:hypothetical protein